MIALKYRRPAERNTSLTMETYSVMHLPKKGQLLVNFSARKNTVEQLMSSGGQAQHRLIPASFGRGKFCRIGKRAILAIGQKAACGAI
jgi:hypothetical protein